MNQMGTVIVSGSTEKVWSFIVSQDSKCIFRINLATIESMLKEMKHIQIFRSFRSPFLIQLLAYFVLSYKSSYPIYGIHFICFVFIRF